MSKLPNAPLLEVIFELRWKIQKKEDFAKYQYLHGDLYSLIKDEYPNRKSLVPVELPPEIYVNNPAHRFVGKNNKYPLIQIGPGILTINTNDEYYFWDEYFALIVNLLTKFFSIYPVSTKDLFQPSLVYIDFLPFDFGESDVLEYLNNNLNLKIVQSVLQETGIPESFNLKQSFNIEFGKLLLNFDTGINNSKEKGLIIQTKLTGKEQNNEIESFKKWLVSSHDYCSILFKQMTNGKLYESFK